MSFKEVNPAAVVMFWMVVTAITVTALGYGMKHVMEALAGKRTGIHILYERDDRLDFL